MMNGKFKPTFENIRNALLTWHCLRKQKIRGVLRLRNTFGDEIRIRDTVEITNGNTHFVTKGHIVNGGSNYGLTGIQQFLAGTYGAAGYGWSYGWLHRLGTGGNVTIAQTNSLTTMVATASTSSSIGSSNPAVGVYKVNWTSTWASGALTAITVTEFGLFYGNSTANLSSRISVADGDFTGFTVNVSYPLVAVQTLTLTFA